MRSSFLLLIATLFLLITASSSRGEYYGIVADQVGEVVSLSQDKKVVKDLLGANLSKGDEFSLESGSSLTVLSYMDDEEWLIKGPVHIKIEADHIVLMKGTEDMIEPLGDLLACYTPDEIASPVSGGLVLRGEKGEDPIELSNTELITKIMNNIIESIRTLEMVRTHYEELKGRMPDSQFIESVEKHFE